ncbi:MAG TPA: hypothetical protein VF426_10315, partial [Marmoricola sp.]
MAYISVRSALAAALTLLLCSGLSGCSGDTSIKPPTAPANTANARAQAGQRALDALAKALDRGRGDDDLVARGSAGLVPAVAANARRLHVRGVDFDYVETDQATPNASVLARWGE